MVNYTNRSGDSPIGPSILGKLDPIQFVLAAIFKCQYSNFWSMLVLTVCIRFIATSYVAATSGALVTALGLNAMVKHAPPLIGRFVPFCAVAAANCVNIPLMRQLELKNGN